MLDAGLERHLRAIVGPNGIVGGEDLRSRSAGVWGRPRTIAAGLLVRPADTGEVAAVLAECNRRCQPVVTHGGLTGTVDGAWAEPHELVLSLERMQAIEELDPDGRTLRVQGGATLQSVQEAAEEAGLMFPLDLGGRGSATLGGNAATNAGGNRVLRYGMVRQSILGLEAVLADGRVLSSLNSLLKNNAGYDLKQLFIGSEGTLGVITRLVLRLLPAPASQQTALLSAPDFASVVRLLGRLDRDLGGQLSAFELLWGNFYDFMAEPLSTPPLPRGQPFYVLAESLGADPEYDQARFEQVLSDCLDERLGIDAVIAKSEQERRNIWAVRDDVVRLWELEPMFLFDVSLPIRAMQDYVSELEQALRERWPDAVFFVFGHLGDGNLHLSISAGPADGSARPAIEQLVYAPLGPLQGSISGEHGIGLEKKPYLSLCRSPDEIEVMKLLKRSLDPGNILNRGKIFDLP